MSSAVAKVIAIFAAIELLGVGGLGALAAARLGFPYVALTPVSFLVYGLAGFFAAKAGGSGAIAGGAVALLDSVTWAVFGGFGPQPTIPAITVSQKVWTIVLVTVSGAACGALGAWVSHRRIAPPVP